MRVLVACEYNAPIPKIAVENPVMHGPGKAIVGRGPSQIIQPWQHGHGEQKATGLWLVNLPPLVPSNVVSGREQKVWKMGPSPERWKDRSRTFEGIAAAMAAQWGGTEGPAQAGLFDARPPVQYPWEAAE